MNMKEMIFLDVKFPRNLLERRIVCFDYEGKEIGTVYERIAYHKQFLSKEQRNKIQIVADNFELFYNNLIKAHNDNVTI